jgi:hypothetical protein
LFFEEIDLTDKDDFYKKSTTKIKYQGEKIKIEKFEVIDNLIDLLDLTHCKRLSF